MTRLTRTVEIEIRPNGVFVADTDTPVPCQQFALCDRPATTILPHPIVGDVPSCERCVSILTP